MSRTNGATAGRIVPALVAGAGVALAVWALRGSRRERIDWAERVVVVTGGSRGLGLAIARRVAAEGARVALLARDASELAAAEADLRARGGDAADVLGVPCDVRDKNAVEQAIAAVVARWGGIDALINNAGIISVGPLEHLSVADFENALATNFWGALHATLAALPHLKARPGARLVNITSVGGTVALPHMIPYVANKHALVGLSDGLRAELAKDGVAVTTVVPGLLRTGSHVNARFKGNHAAEFAWFAAGAGNPLVSEGVESAAGQIVEACRRGDRHLVITPTARLLTVLNTLAPDLVGAAMEATVRVLPGPTSQPDGNKERAGRDSRSMLPPGSPLTRLADNAVAPNNEAAGA